MTRPSKYLLSPTPRFNLGENSMTRSTLSRAVTLSLGLLLLALASRSAFAQRIGPQGGRGAPDYFGGKGRGTGGEITFTFTLPESLMTSAGVYDSAGHKVRDLWGGERLPAGTYTRVWDGLDDEGVPMPAGAYTIKLLHHNLRFEYSNLFNASAKPVGIGTYFQFGTPSSVRSGGSTLTWFCDYNEGGCSTFKSIAAKPTDFEQGLHSVGGHFVVQDGASDHDFAYVTAQRNPYWAAEPQDTYLLKYSLADNSLRPFTSLVPDGFSLQQGNGPAGANYGGNALTCGVNASINDGTYNLAKVAVMTSGRVLAVSQPNANRILFFDKITGLPARAPLSVTKPTGICWSRNEATLFVVSNGTVLQSYRDLGATMLLTASQDKRNFIVDLASDPVSGYVAAAFASPIQQVIAFSSNLNERWRLGKPGGYASTAVVAPDRFHFLKKNTGGSIAFQPDGKLWVYDRALLRMQRFSSPSKSVAVDSTMHLAAPYSFAADPNDGSRLLASQFLGYRRDWNKQNRPGFGGQGAWTLDRFWGYNYVDAYDIPRLDGITRIFSYRGRLYGNLRIGLFLKTVELTDSGVRELDAGKFVFGLNDALDRITFGNPGQVLREPFLGVNGSGVPKWGTGQVIAQYNASSPVDPIPTPGIGSGEITMLGSRVITTYQENEGSMDRYHVGALNPDGTWAWRHGRPQVNSIPFPRNGRTTTSGNVYAIQGVWARDDFVILSWNGEFYDNGQAGKHLIYNADGLYVDQIGQSMSTAYRTSWYPALGMNGNAIRAALLFEGGKFRYLHSTESQTSGILEWTFENLASYGVTSQTATLGSVVTMYPIPPAGQAPQAPGPILDQDNFNRPDSSTLGNGWTKLAGFDGMVIGNGTLMARPSVYDRVFDNIAYKNDSVLDSCQFMSIPESFYSPTLYGLQSPTDFTSQFGLVARLDPSSKRMLIASARYIRYPNVDPSAPHRNGFFTLDILCDTGSRRYSLGGLFAKFLPGAPAHKYSLRFTVSGTQPTRLEAVLYDDTDGTEVLRTYTENWNEVLEQPGACGISIGMQNVRVSRWERRAFTWPLP